MCVPYTNPDRKVKTKKDPVESRIEYSERMLAKNPNNPMRLLALANEYKVGRYEDEAALLERYLEPSSTLCRTPAYL